MEREYLFNLINIEKTNSFPCEISIDSGETLNIVVFAGATGHLHLEEGNLTIKNPICYAIPVRRTVQIEANASTMHSFLAVIRIRVRTLESMLASADYECHYEESRLTDPAVFWLLRGSRMFLIPYKIMIPYVRKLLSFMESVHEKGTGYLQFRASYIFTVFSMIDRMLTHHAGINIYRIGYKEAIEDLFILKATNYIESHFDEGIHLSNIATAIGVSASHLSRRFTDETGQTLTDYTNLCRVSHAIEMLKSGGKNITDVAYDCGFSDLNYFIRYFRRFTGFTPKRYQMLHAQAKHGI